MAFPTSLNTLRSPTQAAITFSQVGGFPRQKNVFIVRFVCADTSLATFTTNLTFATKSVDRPRINPKTEELNQYNKKRQIFTGFKLEPLRIVFYDSADGAAQNMWTIYARYYFGDFNNQSLLATRNNQSYAYDATLNNFNDVTQSGFGFTGRNGGGSNPDSQFFFDRLEIYHFYDGYFDQYNLIHPRISNFDPDGLDYSSSEIATISATIVYENVQYFPAQQVTGSQFSEFQSAFFGNPIEVAGSYYPSAPYATISSLLPNNPSVASLLANGYSTGTSLGDFAYRLISSISGGSLGSFGNFSFGSLLGNNSGNSALSSALGIGLAAVSVGTTSNFTGRSSSGYSGQLFDVANALTTGSSGNNLVYTAASLASKAITGSGSSTSGSLSAAAFGLLNSSRSGTSQLGYNTSSTTATSVTTSTPAAASPPGYIDSGTFDS